MLIKLSDLNKLLKADMPTKRLVLAVADDPHSLGAVIAAQEKNIIDAVLVGDQNKIEKVAYEHEISIKGTQIIHEPDKLKGIRLSVSLVHNKQADILMKGNVKTPDLLRGVLNKEWGLRTGKLLSHFALFEVPTYHKLIAITDVAMNISPNLNEKIGILENSVSYLHKLQIANPKVAVLGAIEVVDEKMSATLDAALLSKMNQRDQIMGCIIDGPLAFDNAVSSESAKHKGIKSDVAGDCDILLVPDIEVGNVLYKSLVFFSNAKVASVVLGASAPIVLTSRSDSEEAKFNSILLAAVGA
ncbi:bifunctional enoyl-CoA hydratase/phosphate acetyltransferase [Saccharicrinis sp. FJH62]|uniref:bifunctional enoyl-CoA hydratase/phosphate acetyltransferase n=1 Tax=Saccharicrinis sp. FJH62 TaxID=3344657 RepID=UPI0035D42880